MSQVNLLPPDIVRAQAYRRRTSAVIVAGAIVLLRVFGFYLTQNSKLGQVNEEIDAQNATNASIQAGIAEKQKFADLQAEAQARQQLLSAAYAGEVSFSALLMDFSRVIPSDAYVDSLALQTVDTSAGDPAAAATGVTTNLVGSISGSGQAVSIDTLSVFLTRLEQVKGWVNPWMSTVSKNDVGYDYSLSVDLTDEVVTERGKGGASDAAG